MTHTIAITIASDCNRNVEVASYSLRNRSEIEVLQGVFGVAVIFFELRLQSLAICDSKSLRDSGH